MVAFHLSRTTFSRSMTVIISSVTFFLIRKLMAVYERYRWTEEITTIQLAELSGRFINHDQTDALVTQKSTDRTAA